MGKKLKKLDAMRFFQVNIISLHSTPYYKTMEYMSKIPHFIRFFTLAFENKRILFTSFVGKMWARITRGMFKVRKLTDEQKEEIKRLFYDVEFVIIALGCIALIVAAFMIAQK